jgi:acetyltransferase
MSATTSAVIFADLKPFFKPKSIAVIGASNNPSRIGGRPIKNLQTFGYKGDIFPVNPKYEAIGDLKCYPSVGDIPDDIDHAIISLPAKFVMNEVKTCVQKKIPTATIYSSGFAEEGPKGKAMEDELVAIARKGGLRFCGPNCQGMINLIDRIPASFTPALEADRLIPGSIGMISQSGAFAGSIFNFAQQRGIGLSYWVSMGNMTDLDVADYMMFMLKDETTQVVAAYVEGFRDKDKLLAAAEEAQNRGKQLVVLKGGVSEQGAKASLSHTGSISGSDDICSAALRQMNVIRVEGVEELFDVATLCTKIKYVPEGEITIITTSGAAGVILSDQLTKYGLELLNIPGKTKEKLKNVLPAFGSAENPVDLTAQSINEPDITPKALQAVVEEPRVSLIIIMFTMVVGKLADLWSEAIIKISKQTDKPIVVCWMATNMAEERMEWVANQNVPVFETPVRCVRALKSLVKYSEKLRSRRTRKSSPHIGLNEERKEENNRILRENAKLTEFDSQRILKTYGIGFPAGGLARSGEEALEIAGRIGYPVVLKVQSPNVAHKTDADLIRLNINNEEDLLNEYRELMGRTRQHAEIAPIQGVLVQKMLFGGTEIIAGLIRDPQFGWAVVFGLGGVFVEVLKDVSYRLVPISQKEAQDMIREIKGYQILEGIRGKPEADLNALVNVLMNLSQMAVEMGDAISEVDLNPVLVFNQGTGAKALDALIVRQ